MASDLHYCFLKRLIKYNHWIHCHARSTEIWYGTQLLASLKQTRTGSKVHCCASLSLGPYRRVSPLGWSDRPTERTINGTQINTNSHILLFIIIYIITFEIYSTLDFVRRKWDIGFPHGLSEDWHLIVSSSFELPSHHQSFGAK